MLVIGALATITAFISALALLVLAVTRLVNAVRKLMKATGFGRKNEQTKSRFDFDRASRLLVCDCLTTVL